MVYVWWQVLLTIVISYLCGNISFSRIISKFKHEDITKVGSGNPGSTNVLRHYGFKFGALNLVLDMMKAYIPCIIAYYVFDRSLVMLYIAGLSCMIGHIYPVFWGFKGGKGIATMMGMFMAANPVATLICLAVGFVVWAMIEYGSIVSFLCITVLNVVEGIRVRWILDLADRKIVCLILFVIFLITWFAHRKNIERLLIGKESKAHLIKKVKNKLKSKKV